jgi:hypothetical protein
MNDNHIKMGLIVIILLLSVLMISGCTYNSGDLINPKNDSKGDILQFTVDITQSNNNSYNVKGMMENRAAKKYTDVNLTVTGYNENKEKISETKIMLPSMAAHDYTNYEAWLTAPSSKKITTVKIEVVNATAVE